MATVIPNRFGESLERSTQNLINLILTTRQLGLEEERIGIAREQADEAQKTGALNRLIALSAFLPEGKSIAELPQIHDTLRTVFPDFDPANPGDLGGVVLNRQTIDEFMQPLLISEFERMSPEARSQLMERGLNRAVLGSPASGTELAAQDARSGLFLEAAETLRKDPVALDGIFRTQLGLQQPIRVNVGGRTLQWDTSQAASLAVQLMMHSDQLGLQREQISASASNDIVAELMKQMENAGQPISRAVGMSVIKAYNQRVALDSRGELTPENDPMAPLITSENPDVSAAAQFFMGAGQIGERTFQDYLASAGPAGQQALAGITIMSTLSEAGVPSDNIMGATSELLKALGGGQPGSTFPGFHNGFFGDKGFQITAPNAGDVQQLNGSPATPATIDPAAIELQAIRDVIESGRGTREQAVAKFGEEKVNQALGPLSTAAPARAAPSNPELAEAEAEFERFMAPVANATEAQKEARRNSATGRRLQRRIERLRNAGQ